MQQQLLDFWAAFVKPPGQESEPDYPGNKKAQSDEIVVAPILNCGRRPRLLADVAAKRMQGLWQIRRLTQGPHNTRASLLDIKIPQRQMPSC
jgi:hypothetical protein